MSEDIKPKTAKERKELLQDMLATALEDVEGAKALKAKIDKERQAAVAKGAAARLEVGQLCRALNKPNPLVKARKPKSEPEGTGQ